MSANSSISQSRLFGEIHSIRKSVQEALQQALRLINNYSESRISTSKSSASSSSTSSNSSKDRPKPRPCLYWDYTSGSDIVLLMTSFEGVNPMLEQNDGKSIVPNVPYEILVKHLVSISPTNPVPGRRSITIEGADPNKRITDHEDNSFSILIPVFADTKTQWGDKWSGAFSNDDLYYIRKLLAELDDEKFKQKILHFPSTTIKTSPSSGSIIPKSRAENIHIIEKKRSIDEDDHDDGTGESSNDSLHLFTHGMKINKFDIVQEWLHHQYGDNNLTQDPIEVILKADDSHLLDKSSEIIDGEMEN